MSQSNSKYTREEFIELEIEREKRRQDNGLSDSTEPATIAYRNVAIAERAGVVWRDKVLDRPANACNCLVPGRFTDDNLPYGRTIAPYGMDGWLADASCGACGGTGRVVTRDKPVAEPEEAEVVYVRITGARKSGFWYADRIGEVFRTERLNDGSGDYRIQMDGCDGMWLIVHGDCVEVPAQPIVAEPGFDTKLSVLYWRSICGDLTAKLGPGQVGADYWKGQYDIRSAQLAEVARIANAAIDDYWHQSPQERTATEAVVGLVRLFNVVRREAQDLRKQLDEYSAREADTDDECSRPYGDDWLAELRARIAALESQSRTLTMAKAGEFSGMDDRIGSLTQDVRRLESEWKVQGEKFTADSRRYARDVYDQLNPQIESLQKRTWRLQQNAEAERDKQQKADD